MKALNKLFVGIGLSLAMLSAQAAELTTVPALSLQDQHEAPLALNAQTQWVLYSTDKASGKITKESLEALGLTDLSAANGIYIADVSAMPSMITKLFALPKMRDYAFKAAIVMDDELLSDWPKQEEKVTAMKLNGLKVESIEYFDSPETLQAWIQKQL